MTKWMLPILLFVASNAWAQKPSDLKPTSSSEFFSFGDEKELEEITDQSIEELQRLLRRFGKSKNRGELWLRLAELYVEKSRLSELRAFRRFDQDLARFNTGKTTRRPKVDLRRAKSYNKKAIKLYENFIRYFPKDQRVDQALFFLGFNHFALGNSQRGVQFYRQLTQNHRRSPYIAESNFALGEFHFERDEWSQAKNYYLKVAKDRNARLFLFSLYKAAWCEYRMGRIGRALRTMELVLKQSRKKYSSKDVAGRKKVNRVKLASEAIRDLVPFYADSGRDPKRAWTYFKGIAGPKLGFSLLEKLAYYYSDTGQKKSARLTFKQLIDQEPLSPKAFDYQYRIVNDYAFSTNNKLLRSELKRWMKQYGPESEWYRRHSDNQRLLKDADNLRESTLRNFVLQTHQTAINSRQEFSQNEAVKGYELYRKSFPNSKNSHLMQFYYAELLHDMKKYEKAHEQYRWIIKNSPDSPYAEPAVINSTIAIEKSLPSDKALSKKLAKSKRRMRLSSEIKRFIDSANTYRKMFPKGKKYVPITFKVARLQYLHRHFDDALVGFKEVVKREPKSKLGKYSAELILDIYNEKGDYKGLQKAGKEILADGVTQNRGGIKDVVRKAAFKNAQDLASAGKHLSAAKGFQTFAAAHKGTKLASDATFNAAVNYDRGGDVLSAISMFGAFLALPAKNKNKKLERQAALNLPQLYIDTGKYAAAAEQYEKNAVNYRKDRRANSWTYNAAIIRKDLGMDALAIKNFKKYFSGTRKKERDEAWYEIAEIHRRKNQKKQALANYEKYISLSPASAEKLVLSHYRVAEILESQRKITKSKARYKKVVTLGKYFKKRRTKVPLTEVGNAAFKLAEPSYNALRAIQFPKLAKHQAAAIKRKLAALETVKREFQKVIALQAGESALASLTVLGRSSWHVYNFFRRIPVPKGLTKSETKAYKKQLRSQTQPFREAARDYYQEAISFSEKNEVYTTYAIAARKEMTWVDPKAGHYYGETIYPVRAVAGVNP